MGISQGGQILPVEMSYFKIEEDRQVYLNKQLINGSISSIKNDKLIFKDQFWLYD